MQTTPMYINNSFVESASGETMTVINPATEEAIAQVPNGNEADANRVVDAASEAFKSWRKITGIERCELLHEAARKMKAHQAEIAELLTLEQGKPLCENEEELEWCIGTFNYYAEMARTVRGKVLAPGENSQFNFVLKEPYGVSLCIIPFNFPLLLMAWKVAPALAAGNTVIIKPAETTPLSTLLLAEKVFDHFPAGVINIVTGEGARIAEPMVKHRDVPLIAFTGSTAVGQRIAGIAASRVKHTHLELGGKDAFVVAPDADISKAAEAVAYAALLNTGQVCTSTERVYVPDNSKADFTEALVEFVKKLRIGPGIEPTTDLGPMSAASYREKVEQHIADAVNQGAKIATGGKRPAQFKKGFYFEPTVLTNVDHSMRCMKEETFGPTIPVMGYDNFDQAIALVNDSDFGLGACVRTNDARLAKQFFEDVQAGTIWINDPLTDNYGGPFGGFKMSGNARELGEEGLESFMETKHVHWDFDDTPKEWWYPY